jgi:hypothetical protein
LEFLCQEAGPVHQASTTLKMKSPVLDAKLVASTGTYGLPGKCSKEPEAFDRSGLLDRFAREAFRLCRMTISRKRAVLKSQSEKRECAR